MTIQLSQIMSITSPHTYKVHFARWNRENHPLETFARSFDEWRSWQEHRPVRDSFNREFIFSLMQVYDEDDSWLFGGVWRVAKRLPQKYEVELMDLGKSFIGRLKIKSPYRGRNARTNLENYLGTFEVIEVLAEPYTGKNFKAASSESDVSEHKHLPDVHSELLIGKSLPLEIYNDIQEIESNSSIDLTTKKRLIDARIGQGNFRKDLLNYWKACAVTGYSAMPTMLIASHIKPWSESSNDERLDPFNGLLLLPSLDKAFDRGLISFTEDGRILISRSLINPSIFGVDQNCKIKLHKRKRPAASHCIRAA